VSNCVQLIVVLVLLFAGKSIFGLDHAGGFCKEWEESSKQEFWDLATEKHVKHYEISTNGGEVTNFVSCTDFFTEYCPGKKNGECFLQDHVQDGTVFNFEELKEFDGECLKCAKEDYKLGSIIFNAFIWCQIFNEYTSRDIFDEWNFLKGITNNWTFIYVSVFTWGAQIFLIELGGDFVKTESLTITEWLITIAVGALGAVVGMMMRFIPVKEDPATFFDNGDDLVAETPVSPKPSSDKYIKVGTDDVSAGVELT